MCDLVEVEQLLVGVQEVAVDGVPENVHFLHLEVRLLSEVDGLVLLEAVLDVIKAFGTREEVKNGISGRRGGRRGCDL